VYSLRSRRCCRCHLHATLLSPLAIVASDGAVLMM
jgi:hypothetical protein